MLEQEPKYQANYEHQVNINMKMDSKVNIDTDNNKFSNRQVLVLLMIVILGALVGWLGFLLFGDLAGSSKILYVSQKEILKLEKERIHQESVHEQQKQQNLFFGQINQAIELIKSEAQQYKDKRTKIIFVTDELITGEDVMSISRQVHEGVIEYLVKLTNNLQQQTQEDNVQGVNIRKQLQLSDYYYEQLINQ